MVNQYYFRPLRSLDLFAGAGGFSLGLHRAGFETIGAIEKDRAAGESYKQNFSSLIIERFGVDQGDITKVDPRSIKAEILQKSGSADIDLLVAGPPCQGFSRIGRAKLNALGGSLSAFIDDPRNLLYRRAIEYIEFLRPRMVVIENVAGMLHHGGQNVAELAAHALQKIGYSVRYTLVNSAWYGVPQSRERVLIIGAAQELGVVPTFPIQTHSLRVIRGQLTACNIDTSRWRFPELFVHPSALSKTRHLKPAVTVLEAIGDLPPYLDHLKALRESRVLRTGRNIYSPVKYEPNQNCSFFAKQMREWIATPDIVNDHFCRWVPRDFETFRLMKPGDTYSDAHEIATNRYLAAVAVALRIRSKPPTKRSFVPPYPLGLFKDKWRKLVPDEPSWTVTAHLAKDTYSHIHYDSRQARAITPREAARLQSFPDGFSFAGNVGDMFRQIGNAVPPLLAFCVGKHVASILRPSTEVDTQVDGNV